MSFLRVLPLTCLIVASVDVASEQAAMTLTPEQEYDDVVKRAKESVAGLEAMVQDLHNTASNRTRIEAIQTKFLKNASNARQQVLHTVLETKVQTNTQVRGLRAAATKAVRAIKSAARKVEKASKEAGAHEHNYERAYDRAEQLSEHMEGHVEDLGDASHDYLEAIYEPVLDGVQQHFDEVEAEAAEKRLADTADKTMASGTRDSRQASAIVHPETLLVDPASTDVVSLVHDQRPVQEYSAAVKQAEDAIGALDAKVRELRNIARNKSLIMVIQTKLLKNISSTRSQVSRSVRNAEELTKTHVRGFRTAAKKAARAIKSAARKAEKASKKTSAYEPDYEKAYMQGERLSEEMEIRAESLGDASEEYIEGIYETVLLGVENHFEEATKRARVAQQQVAVASARQGSALVSPQIMLAVPSDVSLINVQTPEQEYNSAVKEAEDAIVALRAKVRELHNTASNKTLMAAVKMQFLKNASNTKQQVLRSVHETEVEIKARTRGLRRAAKAAARAVKSAGRKVEKASRQAGAHEHDYERAYEKAEHLSERMEDHVENLGDACEDYIEGVYESVADDVREKLAPSGQQVKASSANETTDLPRSGSLPAVPVSFSADIDLLADAQQNTEKQMQTPEQEYNAAVKQAEDKVSAFENKIQQLRNIVHNKTLIAGAQTEYLKNAANATYKEVRRSVREREAETKTKVRALRTTARKAARAIKSAARKVEKASKEAGAHEHNYERAYDRAEQLSEHMEGHVEDLGDASEDYVEDIRESVLRAMEHHFEDAQKQAEALKERMSATAKTQGTGSKEASMLTVQTFASTDVALLVFCVISMVAGIVAVARRLLRRQEEIIETYSLLA